MRRRPLKLWGSLRRPGHGAPTWEGTAAPGPVPATVSAAQPVLLASPINRARTTPSRLPSEVCTGAFGGAKGAALLIDGDEAQGDQVHPPPMS